MPKKKTALTIEERLQQALVSAEEQPYEVPENWVWVRLGSLADVKGGKRLPKGTTFSENITKHPYIRVTDFNAIGVSLEGLKYIDEDVYEKISRYTISSDDIYVSIAGSIGKVGIIPSCIDGANLTENAAKITNIKGINQKYLCLFLKSEFAQYQMQSATIATTQAKLALFRIESLTFPLPPLSEQQRIVERIEELFAKLDEAKERLQEVADSFAVRKAGILHKAFTGELTKQWRRENGVSDESWEEKKLSEITENQDSKRIPLSKSQRDNMNRIYDYYGASGIIDKVDDYIFEGKKLLIGEDGANLVTRSKDIAFIADGKYWVNNHAHILDVKDTVLLMYLCHYINNMDLIPYVTGSAQPKLTQAKMNNIKIFLPTSPNSTKSCASSTTCWLASAQPSRQRSRPW